jgi:hypothetical protein
MTKKMAAGGKASSYEDMTAGSGSGLGRLQKTSIASKTTTQKLKKGGMAYMGEGGGAKSPKKIETTPGPHKPYDRGRYAREKEEDLRAMDRELMRHYKSAESPNNLRKVRPSSDERYDFLNQMEGGYGPSIDVNRTLSNMGKLAKQQEGDYRPAQGFNKGGMTKMAKGGKAEAFEGSPMDMAQDKKLAKKYGMTKKDYEKSPIDAKHDKQRSMKGLKMGGMTKMAMGGYASGGMSTAQDGMKGALRPKPTAMAMGGCAKGGKVTFGSMKPLPGTKTVGPMRPTTATGASMKKDGMKGQLRAKASGAKTSSMMKPLGMTKMAKGGKVRGAGCAQRGTKFIGEV